MYIILCISGQGFTQSVNVLNGKWCFTGFRTTVFSVRNEKLYICLLESRDTLNFRKFLENSTPDTSVFVEATVTLLYDTLKIEADFPGIRHKLNLRYLPGNPDVITFTGDVFSDSASLIRTNTNCQVKEPKCINKLYSPAAVSSISTLKPVSEFTRDHAFEFLLRLSFQLRDKCNRCYAGFTDAYMNEVLIDMGFNPISTQTSGRFTTYSTSGFTFFIKDKFEKDQALGRLSRLLVDKYLSGGAIKSD